jgi:hypothetical protein
MPHALVDARYQMVTLQYSKRAKFFSFLPPLHHVQGFSMLEGKEYRANELLHASHSPLFPFLFLAEN